MDLKTILQQRVYEWNDKTSRDSDGTENTKGKNQDSF